MDGIHCTLTKSVSELNVAFGMSTLEDDELERELVVVGRELAHVNKKLCTQLKAMQALLHEYEASVVVEEMLDTLFHWGLPGWTQSKLFTLPNQLLALPPLNQ